MSPPLTEDDALVAALAAQTGLTISAPALGLGDGRLAAAFFVLGDLDAEVEDRLIADHLDEDVLVAVPGAFVRDADGRRRWARPELEPIAIVGGAETFALGPELADALPAAAVLFRDRASGAVVGWDRVPDDAIVPVAGAVIELDVA